MMLSDLLTGTARFGRIIFVLLMTKTTCSGYSNTALQSTSIRSPASSSMHSDFLKHLPQPKFDDLNIRSINARTAQTVLLPCTVWNVGDKVVSWIRKRDLLIISSGIFTFSGDNRFEPVYSPGRNFWGLRIRGVKESDSGQYECQVNTDPKMSLAINLTVSDQEYMSENSKANRHINIKGSSQIYVHSGSPVVFTCEVTTATRNRFRRAKANSHTSKPVIKWFHNGFQINFDSRSGISIENNFEESRATSKLKLASVKDGDVGQYLCSDGVSVPASLNLYVVEGEHSEAMQRDFPHSSATNLSKTYGLGLFLCIMFLI